MGNNHANLVAYIHQESSLKPSHISLQLKVSFDYEGMSPQNNSLELLCMISCRKRDNSVEKDRDRSQNKRWKCEYTLTQEADEEHDSLNKLFFDYSDCPDKTSEENVSLWRCLTWPVNKNK